jgi:hypothetical protein
VLGTTARSAGFGLGAPLLVVGAMLTLYCALGLLRRWFAASVRATPGLVEVAAVCTAACAVPVGRIVVRQYVERAVVGQGATRYHGPLLPPLLWTSLIAAAVGVAVAVFVVGTALQALSVPHGLLRRRALFAAVTATAFAWRVYALLRIAPARTDGGDPLYYHTQANTLARGLGFIEPLNWIARGAEVATAVHGPGYSVYLSFFSRLGASTWFDHRIASSLVGAASVLLAMLITRRLAGTTAALLAGTFAAFYPNMWTIDGVLFPEGLFIFLCGLVILFAYRWAEHHRRADALVIGIAIGAAALTRGEGIFLIVLLCVPLVWLAKAIGRRRQLVSLAWMAVGCTVLVAPWMLRNLTAFETFVPLSTNGNELHVYSNCEDTYNGKFLGFWLFDCQQRVRDPDGDGVVNFEPAGDEAQKAKYWQSVGFDYAQEHISELPKVVLARVGRQWDLFRPLQTASFAPIEGRDPDWARVALACYYALAVAAVAGAPRLRRRGVSLLPLGAQFVAVTLTAVYAYGTTRFRAPAELALCVLAAVGVAPAARRAGAWLVRRGDRAPSVPPPTGLLRWWPIAVVLAVIGAALRGLYLSPGAPMEEGFMLVFPERLLKGDVANVDFLHLYGPGSLHLLAGVYKVFGTTVDVERTVGLAYNLAIVAALMVLAHRWGRVTAATAGVVATLVVFTPIGLIALAWHGAIALALWSLVVAIRGYEHDGGSDDSDDSDGRRSRLARQAPWLAALLAGLALSFRPDLVLALAGAHGVCWWLAGRPRSRRWVALAGFLGGLLPTFVQIVQAGPEAFWRGVFTEPVFTLRAGRTLPRPPSWGTLDGALQVIGEKPPPWWPIPAIAAPHQLFLWFWLLPIGSIVGLVLAVRWWRRSRSPRHRAMVAIATFGVGLLTQALQRPDSAHLLWGSVVAFPLASCWTAEWWTLRDGSGSRLARLTAVVAPLVVITVLLPFYTVRTYTVHVRQSLGASNHGLPPGLPVVRGDREYRLGDVRAWKASQEAVDALAARAQPGERLLIGPVDLRQTMYSNVFFYFLFPELTPATRYIEMDPGLANADGSSVPADVASADWLILDRLWSGWIEPNDSIVFGSDDANVVVEQQFCLVGSYQRDLVRLYHRCVGGGAPGPYEGPYEPEYDYAVEVKVPVPPRSDGTYPPGSPAAP